MHKTNLRYIYIHALCEEGDRRKEGLTSPLKDFYPRPLRGGRLQDFTEAPQTLAISIHALCEEGDDNKAVLFEALCISIHALCEEGDDRFVVDYSVHYISIHALCEEGDSFGILPMPLDNHFYPRPLRGGRRHLSRINVVAGQFLSTPSARRATEEPMIFCITSQFLSTPSARRATSCFLRTWQCACISIHALCEEGDAFGYQEAWGEYNFYPRPLRGGRPIAFTLIDRLSLISIHALCEEGDNSSCWRICVVRISIHALCEEGDV